MSMLEQFFSVEYAGRSNLFVKFSYLKDSEKLTDTDRAFFNRMLSEQGRDSDATSSL